MDAAQNLYSKFTGSWRREFRSPHTLHIRLSNDHFFDKCNSRAYYGSCSLWAEDQGVHDLTVILAVLMPPFNVNTELPLASTLPLFFAFLLITLLLIDPVLVVQPSLFHTLNCFVLLNCLNVLGGVRSCLPSTKGKASTFPFWIPLHWDAHQGMRLADVSGLHLDVFQSQNFRS